MNAQAEVLRIHVQVNSVRVVKSVTLFAAISHLKNADDKTSQDLPAGQVHKYVSDARERQWSISLSYPETTGGRDVVERCENYPD